MKHETAAVNKNPAAPASTARHNVAKIPTPKRETKTKQVKIKDRNPEFNWHFYEYECRILLTNSSSHFQPKPKQPTLPLQPTNKQPTASPTQSCVHIASAIKAQTSPIDTTGKTNTSPVKRKAGTIDNNKYQRKKLDAPRSSRYYTARYYDC